MQTDHRVLDSLARIFTNAAGAAQAFTAEVETMVKTRLERLVADLDFVPREEFSAVKAMAARARAENEKLAARITTLEAKLAAKSAPAKQRPAIPRPRRAGAKPVRKGKL
jgi:BMFP domain-containing protein YqiC